MLRDGLAYVGTFHKVEQAKRRDGSPIDGFWRLTILVDRGVERRLVDFEFNQAKKDGSPTQGWEAVEASGELQDGDRVVVSYYLQRGNTKDDGSRWPDKMILVGLAPLSDRALKAVG